jgi:hypothetical protein
MLYLPGSLLCAAALSLPAGPATVVKHSDVAFMYQASRKTYDAYGATLLAWGGTPNPKSLAEAGGVKWFGSVGMVTEFGRYYERFPATYQEALCRDIEGRPVKVPWLTDLNHKGIPFWWCCTNQPQFRQFLRERVVEIVKGGAAGLHVDDHLGASGGLWLGLCFCDRCVEGFRDYLKALPKEEPVRTGIADPATYDYRAAVRAWLAEEPARKRQVTQHPLWSLWTAYQCRAAAAFMMELRRLAAKTAGYPIPVAANAGLLWPRHLADYRALDLFVAETDHRAESRKPCDTPLVAYRLAESVGRPYAATASGMDWAFIKEHNLPGLVRIWIALSYAGGQLFMAPAHQWCYTPEKGTHWWDGPIDKFAPLYRFVRAHANLFDGYETYADLGVLVPHRAFANDPGRWTALCDRLAAANFSYRILLAGDEIVTHPLTAQDLSACRFLLTPNTAALTPDDAKRLDACKRRGGVFGTAEEVMAVVRPAVKVPASIRALPRVKPGSAVVHLLNYDYDDTRDDVTPQADVKVSLDLKALGIPGATRCRLVAPGAEPLTLQIVNGSVTVPSLRLWALLVFDGRPWGQPNHLASSRKATDPKEPSAARSPE